MLRGVLVFYFQQAEAKLCACFFKQAFAKVCASRKLYEHSNNFISHRVSQEPDFILRQKGITMKEYTPVKEGKVREIYDLGNELVMVATDRISAFDVILKNKITKKGTVLTQMSKFWFDYTKDILPNHMISVDPEDMPEFFRGEDYCGNSMLVKKLTMLPIECIVRGYITGSGWASYKKNGTVCGIKLPDRKSVV